MIGQRADYLAAGDRGATPVCLTIGSSDSSGGAGIQGDIKAFASIGCFAATVVVGLTAQSTTGVRQRFGVPLDMVAAQFAAVIDDLPVCAVKVGATWSVELVDLIADLLADVTVPIVLDPVLVTAAGGQLAQDPKAVVQAVIERLFPIAEIVTPNLQEAAILAGRPPGADRHPDLAERLVGLGARAALVSAGGDCEDDWFYDSVRHMPISGDRHPIATDHGAGCAQSSVLAGLLGYGVPLLEAVTETRIRVSAGVAAGLTELGSGIHPIDLIGLRPANLKRHQSSP